MNERFNLTNLFNFLGFLKRKRANSKKLKKSVPDILLSDVDEVNSSRDDLDIDFCL